MTSQVKGVLIVPVWVDEDRVKPLVDDDGRLPVSVEAITVSQDVHIHGWDGTQWRKLGLLFGYSDVYAGYAENLNLPAVVGEVAGSTVPAGEVWVVYGLLGSVVSTTCTELRFGFWNGSGKIVCKQVLTPTSGRLYDFQGTLILAAGFYPLLRLYGVTEGDAAYLYAWGYKMKVS